MKRKRIQGTLQRESVAKIDNGLGGTNQMEQEKEVE